MSRTLQSFAIITGEQESKHSEEMEQLADLANKVALVTGGSRGIGAGVAKRLAQDGADVALTYVSAEGEANAVVAEIEGLGRRGLAIKADSADAKRVAEAVDQTVATLGKIDILVNNAGIYPFGPLDEVTLEEVDQTLAIHVRAAFLASQAAAKQMGDGGRIINIGSCFAERVPYEGLSLYAMSKSALSGLSKGLARDLGPRGITANVVHPGCTDTDMNPADGEEADGEREFIALGQYADPKDIAATVAHVASEDGRYITGAAIAVDGGYAA